MVNPQGEGGGDQEGAGESSTGQTSADPSPPPLTSQKAPFDFWALHVLPNFPTGLI